MPARGEVSFVATPLGRLKDPREIGDVADDLKIHFAQALGYLVLLEAFVLQNGDAKNGGKLYGYNARHIARELGHQGPPEKLVRALLKAKVLGRQRGVFFIPNWRETPTGQHAADRAERREYEREKKRAQRKADRAAKLAEIAAGGAPDEENVPGDVPGTTTGRPGDKSGTSTHRRKEGRKGTPGQHPPAPAQSAGELASRRWAEFKKLHDSPMNEAGSARLLGGLSDDEWACVRWLWSLPPAARPRSSSRKKRSWGWDSHRWLSARAFTLFTREWGEKLRLDAAPKNGHAKPVRDEAASAAAKASANRAAAGVFVLQQLADEQDPTKRERIKRRWMETHGAPVPWEGEGEGLQSQIPTN